MVGKDTLFHYYIWILEYYLSLQTNGSLEIMFLTFIDHVLDVNDDSDPEITGLCTCYFKVILDISKHYYDETVMMSVNKHIDDFCSNNLNLKGSLKAHGAEKIGNTDIG